MLDLFFGDVSLQKIVNLKWWLIVVQGTDNNVQEPAPCYLRMRSDEGCGLGPHYYPTECITIGGRVANIRLAYTYWFAILTISRNKAEIFT